MKILWLAPYPNPSLINTHPAPWITKLAQSLAHDSKIDLTIVDFDSTIKQRIESKKRGEIKFIYLRTPTARVDKLSFFSLRIFTLKKFINSSLSKFDLIHVHGTEHQYEQAIININFPSVVSMQGIMTESVKVLSDIFTHQYFRWKLSSIYEKRAIPKLDNFICRTTFDTAFVKDNNPTAKIFTNWEMIRDDFFNINTKICGNKILFIGGLNKLKGIVEVLKTINILNKTNKFKLIIIGYGNKTELSNIINKYGLQNIEQNAIELRGFQDSQGILNAYQECFCLVHPSYIDNSPNSICEAQIAGLPVIASAVGGVSNLINDMNTGILTDLEPKNIASKIMELYESQSLKDKISSNAKKIAVERHNPEIILNKTLNIYHEIATHT